VPLYPSKLSVLNSTVPGGRPPVIPLSARTVYTPTAVIPYTGPGDVVSGASAWWGFRAYSQLKAGTAAINLRRDSDNATSDFSTLANGNLDIASITTWASGANLFVTKLYDQTGNGFDVAQATAAHQPTFQTNAISSSLPGINTASASGYLASSSIAVSTTSLPFTVSFVAARTGGSIVNASAVTEFNDGSLQIGFSNVSAELFCYFPYSYSGTATEGALHAAQLVANGASSDLNVDGVVDTVNFTSVFSVKYGLLAYLAGANPLFGLLAEVGIWGAVAFTPTQSSNMYANQHTYWGF
jgi:hypothetical protein